MSNRYQPFSERFLAGFTQGAPKECWVWRGHTDSRGYGGLFLNGKRVLAHRVSYQMFIGPIPDAPGHHKTSVCHACDNRACVNPAHLFLGSHSENMADSSRKGRQRKAIGAASHRAKLTDAEVLAIRASPARGVDLAHEYGVSQTTVSAIRTGKVWTHLPTTTNEGVMS